MNDTNDSRTIDTSCTSAKKISKSPKTKRSCLLLSKINKNSDFKTLRPNKSRIIFSKRYMNENLNFNKLFTDKKIDKQYLKTKKTDKQKNKDVIAPITDNENPSASTKDSSFSSIKLVNENEKINFQFSKKFYCNYYPKKPELREFPDKKPIHFPSECFHGVNYFHNEIGKKEFLNLTNNSIYNNNIDEYKIIDRKDHLLLNHLCHQNKKQKIINSITVKYRHKNTTFLYYR